ncbi:MAG TPA: hypothetical protein VIA06_01580 [Candidatus Dormibacteraeota bacterium]|nr:hypothetical protein [Candidatus Dormibacteraeota bacterium]
MTVELVHAGVAGSAGTVDPFGSVQATPAVTTHSSQAAATTPPEEPAREASLQGPSPTPGDAGGKDLGPTTAVGPTPVESPRPSPAATPQPAPEVIAGPRQ